MTIMVEDPSPILAGAVIIFLIILVNAYFAAARKAISSVNKGSIREMADEGNPKARSALVIVENPYFYKLAIRCLNIILYMLFAVVCIFTFFPWLINKFENMGLESSIAVQTISVVVLLLLQAVILLSLGELVPRKIAVQHDKGVLLATKNSTKALKIIFKPIMVCITAITFIFLKLFRQRTDVNDNEYSEDDIVEMLEAGRESGELKEEGKKMITGIFAFDDILAYEIMTPRTDVFSIDINDPAEEYIDELMELRYSRIPVYEDDNDNITGILHIKDYLIKAREDGFDNVDIKSILRAPYFVPATKNIDALFFELQKTRQHIAILIDEYGGFCGIVTMEDIIEEVMGNIDDEYDEAEQELTKIGTDLYLVDGGMDIDDLDEMLGIKLVSEDSETIGGFVIDMFGEIPDEDDVGKEVFYENCVFTVKSVKDHRIEQLAIKILPVENKEQ